MEAYEQTDGFEFKKPYKLTLKVNGFSRGRSAVTQNLSFPDSKEYDNPFVFSAKGTNLLLKCLIDGTIKSNKDNTITGKFVMKKQGMNARWEPCIE